MPAAVRLFSGLLLFLLSWVSLSVSAHDALFYLFKVTRISDDGLYTFQNVGSERFLACTEREGASLPTIPFVFDDAFFYVERDAADRNYVNLVSFKLLDRPNNAVSASEHNNAVFPFEIRGAKRNFAANLKDPLFRIRPLSHPLRFALQDDGHDKGLH